MRHLIYLAGTVESLTYEEARQWRKETSRRLFDHGLLGLDPTRGVNWYDEPDCPMLTPAAITERDLYDVRRSSLVIVNALKELTTGTTLEIGYAYAKGIPVILVVPQNSALRAHPMIRVMCQFIAESLEQACEMAQSVLDA